MKVMANFILQVICVWVLMCVPGLIVVSSHLFFGDIFDIEPIDKSNDSEDTNAADISCYENTTQYLPIILSSRFWIEGMITYKSVRSLNTFLSNESAIMQIRKQSPLQE